MARITAEVSEIGTRLKEESATTFLEIDDVTVSFGRPSMTTTPVFENVSLNVARGECVTIVGPSGCGKTTLLNGVAGLRPPDSGHIWLDGVESRGPSPDKAVVFQQASLLPWRTVERNVAYGLELRRELSKEAIAAKVQEVLDIVGLTGFNHHFPHEISGGMQQRANVARALAVEPKLVLMDEPFGALDALTKEMLQDELSALVSRIGQTVMFVTHDIGEAIFLGDRVVVMAGGPGRIVGDLRVPFPRPRVRDVVEEPGFVALARELRAMLRPRISAETA